MKKALALILALALCVGVLAACNADPAETTAPPAQDTTAPASSGNETTAPAEPEAYSFEGKTLDVYAGHASAMDGTDLNRFIEDTLGIDISWQVAPEAGIDALLTERVTPSLVFTTGGRGAGITTMGRYGAYVNLWDYQDLMPNFFALLNDESNPEMVAYKKSFMPSEDELYAAPVFLGGDVQRYAWMYREDIFKAQNLEVPTDWESFLEVLRALKKAYPESYPFTMRSAKASTLYSMSEFAQQFGVNYTANAARDPGATEFYDPSTTEEFRNMIKCIRQLIDEGLMDEACLAYDTAQWQEAFTKGTAFITYDKAFQLSNLEPAGQQLDPNFSLSWFNNIQFFADADNSVPYGCRNNVVQSYAWFVTSKCADLELALRYLDWLYTEEAQVLMSWGIEGESYTVDANGNKQYKEGFDKTYMARYQESGLIDFNATMAGYTPKCQEMILDTMEAANNSGWEMEKIATEWSNEEQMLIDTYHKGWVDAKSEYLAKFLLGDLDVDKDWQQYLDVLAANHADELVACYTASYQRALDR